MKKKLFTFLGLAIIGLFVGYTPVSADESNVFRYNDYYNNFELLPNIVSTYSTQINQLISNFNNSSVGNTYSYYYVAYLHNTTTANQDWIVLFPTSDNIVYVNGTFPRFHRIVDTHNVELWFRYNITTNTFDDNLNYDNGNMALWGSPPILTNTDFIFNDSQYDKFIIPSYTNDSLDVSFPSYELYHNDVIPTYMTLSNGSYDTYTTINVNDYAYVVLSLKNYNQDTFWTNIYTQGRLCLTPVYNYGMTQKQDIISGSQNQGCTIKYNTFTPVNVNIIQSDIDNNAVYYITPYDNEITIIKVDTRVFDISYISQANASNPSVLINGRSYPVIPYSELTDTANISTDTGYISGQVCNPGDVNCAGTITGVDISDLFTQPLQLLKTLWTSISSVMLVITTFITFLPPTLQAFLYTSFFLVLILGIIKVIV